VKTFIIIWGVVIIACILEAYFYSKFIDDEYDEYGGDK